MKKEIVTKDTSSIKELTAVEIDAVAGGVPAEVAGGIKGGGNGGATSGNLCTIA